MNYPGNPYFDMDMYKYTSSPISAVPKMSFSHVILIAIVLVILFGILYNTFDHKNTPQNTLNVVPEHNVNFLDEEKQNINVNIQMPEQQHGPILPPPINPLREYDYRALSDPLVPPYKRDDYTVPLPSFSTRGPISAFKKMGLLIDKDAPNDDKYKFMLLMGRQKYMGSNYYDYYVTDNKPDSALKFDLPNLHKELMTGDTVPISQLNKTYVVDIDRSLGFDYYPFIY